MSISPLFYPIPLATDDPPIHHQVQLALAIAQSGLLKSLLSHCIPVISPAHIIGNIKSSVGVPSRDQMFAEGILEYESLRYVLAEDPEEAERRWLQENQINCTVAGPIRRPYWESDIYTIGKNISQSQTIALLRDANFSPQQIDLILNLPSQASYRSWWYGLDAEQQFTVPLLRNFCLRRCRDGNFTLQYKDCYDQEKPDCFQGHLQKVLVEIKADQEPFIQTLRRINSHREALGIQDVVLICQRISDLEVQGFINQGISVYPTAECVLPLQSDCRRCTRRECAMQGSEQSPVVMCYGFSPETHLYW